MHAGEDLGLLARETLERRAGMRSVRLIVHRSTEGFARAENVALGESHCPRAAPGEEIAAEQRASLELHHEAALPAVRHVRRIEPLERMPPRAKHITIGERPCRADGNVMISCAREAAASWKSVLPTYRSMRKPAKCL